MSNSSPRDTTTHGRAVSVSTLPVCRPGDYVLVADCINDGKITVWGNLKELTAQTPSWSVPEWFWPHTSSVSFFLFLFLSTTQNWLTYEWSKFSERYPCWSITQQLLGEAPNPCCFQLYLRLFIVFTLAHSKLLSYASSTQTANMNGCTRQFLKPFLLNICMHVCLCCWLLLLLRHV